MVHQAEISGKFINDNPFPNRLLFADASLWLATEPFPMTSLFGEFASGTVLGGVDVGNGLPEHGTSEIDFPQQVDLGFLLLIAQPA